MTLEELSERFSNYAFSEVVVCVDDDYIDGILKSTKEIYQAYYITDMLEQGKIVLVIG